MYLQKNRKLQKFCNLELEFQKSRLSDVHYPLIDTQAKFKINRLIRYQITTKKIISTDGRRQTIDDRRTNGRQTDGQTSHTTTIGSLFEERKTTTNHTATCNNDI